MIHTENARLKDLVVQFRSSNEDMAQRALDDSRRLEKLAEENDALRTSVAAYQAERERMARAFQNLQQQVQVVLSERGTLSAMNPPAGPGNPSLKASRPLPPEGRLLADGQEFQLDLADWFLPGTAIIKPGQEARLKNVSAWLEPQLNQIKEVSYVSLTPKRDQLARVSTSPKAGSVKSENFEDLPKYRAERFWEALLPNLPADKAASLRLSEELLNSPMGGQPSAEGTIRFRF
ncbi:MAG: hypothetical protein ACKO85_00660 [Isosphaeraceae bacterium]